MVKSIIINFKGEDNEAKKISTMIPAVTPNANYNKVKVQEKPHLKI